MQSEKKREFDDIELIFGRNFSHFDRGRGQYINLHADHLIILNAKVFINEKMSWTGDLDLTIRYNEIIKYSRDTKTIIHIMYPSEGQDHLCISLNDGRLTYSSSKNENFLLDRPLNHLSMNDPYLQRFSKFLYYKERIRDQASIQKMIESALVWGIL